MPTNNNSFTSTRSFGVEIEFCTELLSGEVVQHLTDAGLNVRNEDYNHHTRNHWKIVPDGSISQGFELVSPPLSGGEGLAEVILAARVLVQIGCYVDTSCGLHVHVDANDLSGASVVNAVRRMVRYESEIDTMVPAHRRSNSFALSNRQQLGVMEQHLSSDPDASARTICGVVSGRYRKLNTAAYIRHGTLEFRQHSGSIDGTKIANWIMFCVQFVQDSIVTVRTVSQTVQAAPVHRECAPPWRPWASTVSQTVQAAPVQAPVTTTTSAAVPTRERTNARNRQYRKLLELFVNAGAYRTISTATICAALEIAESSVPSYISMFRDAFPSVYITARRGRGYYTTNSTETLTAILNPVPVPPPTPAPVVRAVTEVVVPPERGLFANLPQTVKAYYQERIMDFRTV
jgi:hypothetical protein